MNFLKSRWGGFGMSPAQEQRESSSDPKPLYGGTIFDGILSGFGAARLGWKLNFSTPYLEL